MTMMMSNHVAELGSKICSLWPMLELDQLLRLCSWIAGNYEIAKIDICLMKRVSISWRGTVTRHGAWQRSCSELILFVRGDFHAQGVKTREVPDSVNSLSVEMNNAFRVSI